MKKSIFLKKRVALSLATKMVELAIKSAQHNYKAEHKSFSYLEDKTIDLLKKEFQIILGDDRTHLSAFGIQVILDIKIMNVGVVINDELGIMTEFVDEINVMIDDEVLDDETESLSVLEHVVYHIKNVAKNVAGLI
ncbi:MAG: hypothetical protein WC872_01475 [Candidatus Absconditabacterales bacterium]|jgi:hypothetical protein